MRVFFGLELSSNTILEIANWRDRELQCGGRPVPPENFHITLAFVGEVRAKNLESLLADTDQQLANGSPGNCALQLDQVGYWHKPGIFWLGSTTPPAAIKTLAKKLRSLASAHGGRLEKKTFQPHVTLYRRCETPPPAPPTIPHLTLSWEHFTLFESVQGRQGVHYRALEHWTLS